MVDAIDEPVNELLLSCLVLVERVLDLLRIDVETLAVGEVRLGVAVEVSFVKTAVEAPFGGQERLLVLGHFLLDTHGLGAGGWSRRVAFRLSQGLKVV